jgi:hypothetical protein
LLHYIIKLYRPYKNITAFGASRDASKKCNTESGPVLALLILTYATFELSHVI